MESGCPYVRLKVAGVKEETFLIDTGNVGLSGGIDSAIFRQLVNGSYIVNTGSASEVSVGGKGETQAGFLKSLALGPYRNTQLLFSASNQSKIGLSLLSRYDVTFDFPNNQMFVKPGTLFQRPEYVDRSGLGLIERDGRVLIERVGAGTPAQRTGLRSNDQIVTIDGMQAIELRLFAIKHLLCQAGRTVRLTVRRGGENYGAELKLR
jgi:hypothetical protein